MCVCSHSRWGGKVPEGDDNVLVNVACWGGGGVGWFWRWPVVISKQALEFPLLSFAGTIGPPGFQKQILP